MDMQEILDKMKSVGMSKSEEVPEPVTESPEEMIALLKKNAFGLKRVRDEYDRRRNSIEKDKARIQEKISEKYGKVLDPDLKEMRDLIDAARTLHTELGSGKGADIFKVFKAVFQNMCAKTIDLIPHKDYSNPGITCGKFGFGLKHNKVSRRVDGIDGMMRVLGKATEISTELNKFNHMKKWAAKLDLFKSLMPGDWIFKTHDATIELEQPVLIPHYGDFEIGKTLKLVFNEGYYGGYRSTQEAKLRNFMGLMYDNGKEDSDRRVEMFNIDVSRDSWENALVYMQLREEVKRRKGELISLVDTQLKTANEAVNKLQSAFIKDIMLNDV